MSERVVWHIESRREFQTNWSAVGSIAFTSQDIAERWAAQKNKADTDGLQYRAWPYAAKESAKQ